MMTAKTNVVMIQMKNTHISLDLVPTIGLHQVPPCKVEMEYQSDICSNWPLCLVHCSGLINPHHTSNGIFYKQKLLQLTGVN